MKRFFLLLLLVLTLTNVELFGQNTNAEIIVSDRIIKVDYNNTDGDLNTMFKECIGAGRANEGLRADWQQQLALVKEECDFKYIRMHGLLSDDMGVYSEDENGNPKYNYQYIDVLYDWKLLLIICYHHSV